MQKILIVKGQRFINWANNKYKSNLELDRINNDLGYSPENCRFTNRSIQQRNKHNNLKIINPFNNKTENFIDFWEKYHNPLVAFSTARQRLLYYKWPLLASIKNPPYIKQGL